MRDINKILFVVLILEIVIVLMYLPAKRSDDYYYSKDGEAMMGKKEFDKFVESWICTYNNEPTKVMDNNGHVYEVPLKYKVYWRNYTCEPRIFFIKDVPILNMTNIS